MIINYIEELNNNIVKAFAVPKEQARWRIYSHNIKSDMEDLKYYKELGDIFSITPNNMVRLLQTHTNNIRVVTKDVAGEGVVRKEFDEACDGAITNESGIMLLSVEADCTPVYIFDRKNIAIGMVHSGWRGTVSKITINAINLMKENYGTNVEDLFIYLGPSICQNCYEVDGDLIPEFEKILDKKEIEKIFEPYFDENGKKKYHLDVSGGLRFSLLHYGLKESQIKKSNICTYHSGIYDSWRLSHDKTKQMLTGMIII